MHPAAAELSGVCPGLTASPPPETCSPEGWHRILDTISTYPACNAFSPDGALSALSALAASFAGWLEALARLQATRDRAPDQMGSPLATAAAKCHPRIAPKDLKLTTV